MLTLETFKLDWDKQFPDIRLRRSHFVLAVSGGVDSIVLAHIMHSLNAKCTIAHVNFQLRAEESKRDEQFVRDFALQINIPFQVQVVDTQKYAATYKMGIQEAAREIRYAWFGALMQELSATENKNSEDPIEKKYDIFIIIMISFYKKFLTISKKSQFFLCFHRPLFVLYSFLRASTVAVFSASST